MTSTLHPPRQILPTLSTLSSFLSPTSLLPITLVHSTVPALVSTSTPLFLRNSLSISPISTPTTYSLSSFCSSAIELFLRLPLETVLRRAQVAALTDMTEQAHKHQAYRANLSPSLSRASSGRDWSFMPIVRPGPYKGILGTMWFIVREEGVRTTHPLTSHTGLSTASTPAHPATQPGFANRARIRKGQGFAGLWRGWRVGFWGLAGVWGGAALGGAGKGGEF